MSQLPFQVEAHHPGVLVAHVGIVVVVAEERIGLVRGGLLRTALGGRRHEGEAQAVVALGAEQFLHRREVGVRIIVHAVHVGVAALARGEREGIGPAVVERTRRIGGHQAEAVHRVAVHHAGAESLAHLRGAGVDVGHAGHAADTEVGGRESGHVLLVARGVVQAAPQRPGAVAGHGVVEAHAVQVDVRVLRIVAADVETHFAELIRGDVVEHILRSRQRRGQRLRVGSHLGVELGEHRVVDAVLHVGRHDHRAQVFFDLIDTHRDVEVLVVRRLETEFVIALGQIRDAEAALGIGRDDDAGGFDDHFHVAQRGAVVPRHDFAPYAAVLGVGRSRRHQQQGKE